MGAIIFQEVPSNVISISHIGGPCDLQLDFRGRKNAVPARFFVSQPFEHQITLIQVGNICKDLIIPDDGQTVSRWCRQQRSAAPGAASRFRRFKGVLTASRIARGEGPGEESGNCVLS